MGEEREKDARQSIAMARVTQSGQEDQALVPRMALSSTTRRWLLVRLSICGLRIPQRLGAGEGRGAEGVQEAQDRRAPGPDPGKHLSPSAHPSKALLPSVP